MQVVHPKQKQFSSLFSGKNWLMSHCQNNDFEKKVFDCFETEISCLKVTDTGYYHIYPLHFIDFQKKLYSVYQFHIQYTVLHQCSLKILTGLQNLPLSRNWPVCKKGCTPLF